MTIKKHFHINNFAVSLVLKQKLGAARKWPVSQGMQWWRGRQPPAPLTSSICLMPTLSTAVIDRTFNREDKSSRHVALVAKCLDLNKLWS